jgi:hypothetical protein
VKKLPDMLFILLDKLRRFEETWELPADYCGARL